MTISAFDSTGVTVPVRLVDFSEVVVATATNDGRLVRRRPWQYDGSSPGNRNDDLLSAESSVVVDCRLAISTELFLSATSVRQLCSSGYKISASSVHLLSTQVDITSE